MTEPALLERARADTVRAMLRACVPNLTGFVEKIEIGGFGRIFGYFRLNRPQ